MVIKRRFSWGFTKPANYNKRFRIELREINGSGSDRYIHACRSKQDFEHDNMQVK